jgi:hypothetical protein
MTVLSANQIKHLNKMNSSASAVMLGTRFDTLLSASATQNAILGFSGSLTISAAQMNASRIVITTGLSAISEGKWIVQGFRSGSAISNQLKVTAGSVAGTMIVASASGFAGYATNDTLCYMGFA